MPANRVGAFANGIRLHTLGRNADALNLGRRAYNHTKVILQATTLPVSLNQSRVSFNAYSSDTTIATWCVSPC